MAIGPHPVTGADSSKRAMFVKSSMQELLYLLSRGFSYRDTWRLRLGLELGLEPQRARSLVLLWLGLKLGLRLLMVRS